MDTSPGLSTLGSGRRKRFLQERKIEKETSASALVLSL
jgi:hypothetical protein